MLRLFTQGSSPHRQAPGLLGRAMLALLFLLPAIGQAAAQNGESPADILSRVQKQYDRVRDYQVNIRAEVDMKGFSAPEMTARLYFKQPDKVHIESEGFAMLPRDAVSFRPGVFAAGQYDMVLQGTEKVAGVECSKLKLLATSDTVRLQRVMLYVDTKRDLVLRMDADPGRGASARADFSYTKRDGSYWLPERIILEMDSPMSVRRPGMPSSKKADGDGKAKIILYYSDYVVNKGIPDSVFKQRGKNK